jgi:integrase/recombinase XerD
MSRLRQALADYLAMRRALGYKLICAERLLGQFISYLEECGELTITIEHALAWATLPANSHPSWPSTRLETVRHFATHLQVVDPATEVPPPDLLPRRRRKSTPYLYSDQQIALLLNEARKLRPPHRAATYRTLIGLLVVTGLRIGEATRLDRDDFDHRAGLIVVRDTKFGKSRELPLHESTVAALRRYLRRTDRPSSAAGADAVFVSTTGARLSHSSVDEAFRQLLARAGIERRSAICRPRLHDLRHTFAVATILDAYRDEGEVEGRLATLCTYLGHVDPASTYWYLSTSPELMELAAQRLERHLGDRS